MLILSKENTNIKLIQKLLSSKKMRDEYGYFIIEGIKVFEDALKENLEIEKVFITEKTLQKHFDFFDKIKDKISEDKLFTITDEISLKLSDTKSPQGLFCIAKKIEKKCYIDKIKNGKRFLILDNIQDPGNIGTIIRTADAVGLNGIILSNDCCDIYNPKVVRSTMGSLFRMNCYEDCEVQEAVSAFKAKNIPTFASVIDSDANSLTDCDFSSGGAVLIGNEGNGLSQKIVDLCDFSLTIKMKGNVNSLNAAMAASIIVWEMSK